MTPTKRSESRGRASTTKAKHSNRGLRVRRLEIALFTRQLAVVIGSGVPIRDGFEVLEKSATSPEAAAVMSHLRKRVEAGWKLSAAMATLPGVFNNVYLAMVSVGEETGQIVATLQKLADWLDSETQLLKRIRSAMTYPVLVLMVAGLLCLGFFIVIFPGFADSLASAGEVPLLTRVLMLISATLRSWLFWLALFLVLIPGLTLTVPKLSKPENRLALWRLLSAFTPLQLLLQELAASRFCAGMGILLETGVDIRRSFRLASLASGSPLLLKEMESGLQYLSQGEALSAYMSGLPDCYPPIMVGLVRVGEEAACMPQVFRGLARTFNESTEYRLEVLAALLEPVLMAFVAVVVGTLLIGVAMPMYGMINSNL